MESPHRPANPAATVSTSYEVLGLFAVLAVSLLIQPHGSLLYRRAAIRPWRLNPIAALIEAGIIFSYLTVSLWRLAWRKRADVLTPLQRCSWKEVFFAGQHLASHLARDLHCNATALLVVRAEVDLEDDEECGDEKVDTMSRLNNVSGNSGAISNLGAAILRRAHRMEIKASKEIGEPKSASKVVDPLEQKAHGHISPPGLLPNASPPSPTLAEGIEDAIQSDKTPGTEISATEGVRATQKSELLRQALGVNTLSYEWLLVQIGTTLFALMSCHRLLSYSTISWPLLAWAAIMIFSWLTVATLLLAFHARQAEDMDLAAVTQHAGKVRQLLAPQMLAFPRDAPKFWRYLDGTIIFVFSNAIYFLAFPEQHADDEGWARILAEFCYGLGLWAALVCSWTAVAFRRDRMNRRFHFPWDRYDRGRDLRIAIVATLLVPLAYEMRTWKSVATFKADTFFEVMYRSIWLYIYIFDMLSGSLVCLVVILLGSPGAPTSSYAAALIARLCGLTGTMVVFVALFNQLAG